MQVSQRQGHAEDRRRRWCRASSRRSTAAGVKADFVQFDGNSVKARFGDTDTQLKAKDAIGKALNPDPADPSYIVALNLLSRSPQWLTSLHALPMYLGLDLRGGVHFLMQVDMKSALTKKAEALTGDIRTLLRDKNLRHAGITRDGNNVDIRFRDAPTLDAARRPADRPAARPAVDRRAATAATSSSAACSSRRPRARVQETAVKQNITTLHNRVNELGVAEPVIQQQGAGPRGRAVAGRAGHGQGQGHHRPHRHAGGAHGRRQRRGRGGRGRQRPGALRHRALRRARRRAADPQAPGHPDRREPRPTRRPASTARRRSRPST